MKLDKQAGTIRFQAKKSPAGDLDKLDERIKAPRVGGSARVGARWVGVASLVGGGWGGGGEHSGGDDNDELAGAGADRPVRPAAGPGVLHPVRPRPGQPCQ